MYRTKHFLIPLVLFICLTIIKSDIILQNYHTYSGKEFNEWAIQTNRVFVKQLNSKENHFGLPYKDGENIDFLKFNPTGSCQGGGLYFSEFRTFDLFDNPNIRSVFLRQVIISDDALVYIDNGKFKANKIFLKERYYVGEHPFWNLRKEDSLEIIKRDPYHYYFSIIEEQTLEMMFLIVKRFEMALGYINEQTPEICLKAVKLNGLALEYVDEQSHEICLEAVKQNGNALEFVKKQSYEICLAAVKQNGLALKFVKVQSHEICLEAVKQDGITLFNVKEQSHEICLAAVKQNGYMLKFVKEQSHEICLEAVKQVGIALLYVKELSYEICLEAVKQDSIALSYVKELTSAHEICLKLLNSKVIH